MTSPLPGNLPDSTRLKVTWEDRDDGTTGADTTTPNQAGATAGGLAENENRQNEDIIALAEMVGADAQGTFVDVATRLNAMATVRKTADQSFTTTTLANVTDLVLPLAANTYYAVEFFVAYSAGTGRGIRLALDVVTATITAITYGVDIYGQAADGTDSTFMGVGTSDADPVISTAAVTSSTYYFARVHGIVITTGTPGTLQLQAAQGGGGTASNATVRAGSFGRSYAN